MFYRIDGIESGMIECLTAAKPDYLRFVGSYGGELMGGWQAVIRALPAVWVAFQGMTDPKPCNTAQTRFEARVQFSHSGGQPQPAQRGHGPQGRSGKHAVCGNLSDAGRRGGAHLHAGFRR